jgi:ABC-type transport system substrate-binding protein
MEPEGWSGELGLGAGPQLSKPKIRRWLGKMKNMKILFLVIAGFFLVGLACGGQSAPPPGPTAAPAATPAVAPAQAPAAPAATAQPQATPAPTQGPAAAAPKPKGLKTGTLLRLGDDPPTLDPHLTTDATSAVYIVEVFGGLVTIDRNLNIVPDLAESWDISNGGRTYTFHLRKDAKFHNGKPVAAQDFKWSLERIADPATESPVVDTYLGDIVGLKDKLNGKALEVQGVKVIDANTLEITIDAPKAFFLSKLTYPTAYVLDRENVEGNPNWFRKPNGTGPFQLAEYVPGEVLRLKENGFYHLGPPKLEEVQFIISGGDAMLMYENDEIHVTGVSLLNLEGILDPSNPLNRDVHQASPSFDVGYVGMNTDKPPFDDPKVRQAFNYAIDRETISRTLLQDLVAPAKGILPPGFPGYNPGLEGYKYDPEKARQLLKESKYGNNLKELPRIQLTLPGSFGAPVSPAMEAVLQMWRENLGIEMEILQTEWAIFLKDLHQRRFQMFGGLGWVADYPDPENFLDVLFYSKSTNNQTGYVNQGVDRLLEKARVEPDQASRFAIYHDVEKRILSDAPWVPLWHGKSGYVLIKPSVKDYFLFPLIIPQLRYVYMTEP